MLSQWVIGNEISGGTAMNQFWLSFTKEMFYKPWAGGEA